MIIIIVQFCLHPISFLIFGPKQAVYDFCEPVDEVEENILRVRVQADMSPEDVAREVLGRVKWLLNIWNNNTFFST